MVDVVVGNDKILMKTSLSVVILCFLAGCGTAERKESALHDMAHRARPPVVDIAVNLGLKHEDDLRKLYDSLASQGVRCGIYEPHTPTKARTVPEDLNAGHSFSAMNTSRRRVKLAYFKLNTQTPCPPRGAVPVNQGRTWENFFISVSAGSLSVMDATVPAMSA